jgi:hypothetical protein
MLPDVVFWVPARGHTPDTTIDILTAVRRDYRHVWPTTRQTVAAQLTQMFLASHRVCLIPYTEVNILTILESLTRSNFYILKSA